MTLRVVVSIVTALALAAAGCGAIEIGSSSDAGAGGMSSFVLGGGGAGGAGNPAHAGRASAGDTGGAPAAGASFGGASAGEFGVAGAGGASDAGRGGAEPAGAGGDGGEAGRAPPACTAGTLVLAGRVTSPRGEPLAGVGVELSGDAARRTVTDADGRYVLAGLCPGAYTVTPSLDGLGFCRESAVHAALDRDVSDEFTGSPGGCDGSPIERRVLAVVYDPNVTSNGDARERLSRTRGWEDPAALARRAAGALEAFSNGRVRFEIVERVVDAFPPDVGGVRYTEADYAACLEDPSLCVRPGSADATLIVEEAQLCDAVSTQQIDEIWVLGGPHFGLSSFTRLPPYCLAAADIVGFDVAGGLPAMLAVLHDKSERVLKEVFADWKDYEPDPLENFLAVAPAGASGCGSAATAPNTELEHVFDSAVPAASHCDAFYAYPFDATAPLLTAPTPCAAWSCTELGYRAYWFRHLPRGRWVDRQGKLGDWWRYVFRPDDRIPDVVTCSSSLVSGWCTRVEDSDLDEIVDGPIAGRCNQNEWATAGRATGWVEFNWRVPIPVRSLEIHDRACRERVLRGHVEFSDGSESIEFGPLEGSGVEPTLVEFEEKMLRGIKVFIDESIGGDNPGFGEITVR